MLLPRVVVLDHNVMIDRWPKTEWGDKHFVFPDKHRGFYSRVYYHDIRRWHYHRRSNGFLTGWANLWSGCHGNAGFIKISVSKKKTKNFTINDMSFIIIICFLLCNWFWNEMHNIQVHFHSFKNLHVYQLLFFWHLMCYAYKFEQFELF